MSDTSIERLREGLKHARADGWSETHIAAWSQLLAIRERVASAPVSAEEVAAEIATAQDLDRIDEVAIAAAITREREAAAASGLALEAERDEADAFREATHDRLNTAEARVKTLETALAGITDYAEPEMHRGPDSDRWQMAMDTARAALAPQEPAATVNAPAPEHPYTIEARERLRAQGNATQEKAPAKVDPAIATGLEEARWYLANRAIHRQSCATFRRGGCRCGLEKAVDTVAAAIEASRRPETDKQANRQPPRGEK